MQRAVDNVLAVAKESVKTFTYEALNNIVRFINGLSALLLTFLPGKANILEGVQGWELRPTFRGPRFPRWMEKGASSFNHLIHELSVDSEASSRGYSSGEEDNDGNPSSPISQSSRASRTTFQSNNGWHWTDWIVYMFSWMLLPAKLLLVIPFRILSLYYVRRSRAAAAARSPRPSHLRSFKRIYSPRDPVVNRTTDRRRGVIEDLHLAIEMFIEAIFDMCHKAVHYLLSPFEVFKAVLRWFLSPISGRNGVHPGVSDVSVTTATLGSDDPAVAERRATLYQSLNTDARTCQDVITEMGYPYEAIHVITSDGYVLLLERMPRREARKAVFLQHGILDSSMGWVSNGVVGSPAFAAYDQGYDVFLGNFRGLVSREHVDKNISSRQYWNYSINEHGIEDIPAMIEKINEVKTAESKISHPEEEITNKQPYKLCAICHSLGGAAILMYIITSRIEENPHRLSRLVLLSPAGFHDDSSLGFTAMEYLFCLLAPIMAPLVPAFYIPTRFFRLLFNKLVRDFHNYPAVGGLVQTLMSYVVGGDSSNWVGVLGLPHYNMNDMPGVAFRVVHHLAQMKRAGRFRMYDYGNASTNNAEYGSPEPLDLGKYYGLIDIPVDLVAGRKDTIIRPSMVRRHYNLMNDAEVDVSYNEFEYAHLDFTFAHHEELLAYVMSRLLLVEPAPKHLSKMVKSKRKEQESS